MAVVGISDDLKGQLPLALYVTKKDDDHDESVIGQELIEMVRREVGAVASFKLTVRVPDLPRTRSGKTPRKILADLASGRQAKVLSLFLFLLDLLTLFCCQVTCQSLHHTCHLSRILLMLSEST